MPPALRWGELMNFLKDRLLHFLVLGAALFAVYVIGPLASFWVIDRVAAF